MERPKIRESIDVYITEKSDVAIFYYLNTRQELRLRVNDLAATLLPLLDGTRTRADLSSQLEASCGASIREADIAQFLDYLETKCILTDAAFVPPDAWFSADELTRYDRQISFWGDFCRNTEEKFLAQKRLKDSSVVIFGCGAVGSWIAVELTMMGVGHITLVDDDLVEPTDVARHALFSEYCGGHKVEVLAIRLSELNPYTRVSALPLRLTPDLDLASICHGATVIVNCADEPYIGLTSLKVSEYCVPRRIPHFIGGGFDAHLASTGELVLPFDTPCANCYADHFSTVLKEWNPADHPVKNRHAGMGGLSCLSVFSASIAVLDTVKVITGLAIGENQTGRGEFRFDTMNIDYVSVQRNPRCRTCGTEGPR